MTMLEAGSLGEASSTAAGEVGKSERKIGLTGSQKASAIGGTVPSARTHHPYLLGLILIASGSIMLVGSLTGALPSMIAALFDPSILDDASGSSFNLNSLVTNAVSQAINPLGGL